MNKLNSNFGNRFMNIDIAISYLEQYEIKLIKKSSYYESPSYPDPSKPKFINVVVEVSTSLPPEDLASVLIYVEEKLERKRNQKNEPRTCDIDIIDYEGKNIYFKYTPIKKFIRNNKIKKDISENPFGILGNLNLK